MLNSSVASEVVQYRRTDIEDSYPVKLNLPSAALLHNLACPAKKVGFVEILFQRLIMLRKEVNYKPLILLPLRRVTLYLRHHAVVFIYRTHRPGVVQISIVLHLFFSEQGCTRICDSVAVILGEYFVEL